MTVEYDSLTKMIEACRVLDAHGIGWAAASAVDDDPIVGPTIVYRLYASEIIPA